MNPSSVHSAAKSPSRSAIVAAFAVIYLVWGSTYLAIRVAVSTMPPFAMAGARFLIAGGVLLGFLKLRGAAWPTARQWRINAAIGTFLLLGGNGGVVYAEQVIPSGIAALLVGICPLFIVLVEWAWPGGERPTAPVIVALLLGFGGVAWLAAPWESTAGGGLAIGGVLAIIASTISWSIGSIYSRHAKHGAEPFVASALQMLGGGGVLVLFAGFTGDWKRFDSGAVSTRSWEAFAYLIVVGSLVGFSTFVWLMRNCKPALVATYAYVNPIVAVFLGWFLLDEPIGPRTLIASAIIVTSVAIITAQKSRTPSA